jgi:hypothetical protein
VDGTVLSLSLILLFSGYRSFVTGVKRSGRDVDHISPSSAEVKNVWRCTLIAPYIPSWRGEGEVECGLAYIRLRIGIIAGLL